MAIDFEVSPSQVDFGAEPNEVEFSAAASAGTAGTSDHRNLTHRDAINQHPIGAISGLEEALDNINSLPEVTEADNNRIMRVVGGEWALTAFYTVTSNEAGGNTLSL